ncbi:ROK family transcriptional regulator [Oceanobacillus caeni]|uniref:ROK family transcriptional regulator n=1 Tax=Bacillaceae TaxID=186817 RepID=UPI000622A61E|nr:MULTISPECIES: ROK family transcriptional regulator [Bacillaceae]KKE78536.1 ROK family protein [Bacilli bacterium VT-13-104]PZD85757.1 ROK family transcriptional regulator [Bacilli bacterium]MBU8791071.1 ROK family transcriptional regulator [Oceanobacillus caeni]MCR1835190.1 ROK family transcriptional regulator [Oceanobacillus caeni]MED4473171.1 ROK family transcriptional regulator [Oceanobacillus caeni]
MVTGDGAYIKRINRNLILQEIMNNGLISRAELSKITGLNKATISVQVQDLLKKKLIYETQQEHHAIGRRPIMLSINGSVGYVLGIDIDFSSIQFAITNIKGKEVEYIKINPETKDYESIVQLLTKYIQHYMNKFANSPYGLISVIIAVHGTVNNDEVINFVPKLQWKRKNLKADLENQLDIEIHIVNNANLSAYAEKVYSGQNDNLMSLMLTSGIGAGIIMDDQIHKGFNGYAGEMGHMIISPDGKKCPCGNNGCWELYASESTLLMELSQLLNRPTLTLKEIAELIERRDSTTMEYIKQFIKYLSIGINNMINLYNPETIVINSGILRIYPNTVKEIKSHLKSSISDYREITISKLGIKACVIGACAFAISKFLGISNLRIQDSDQFKEQTSVNNQTPELVNI